MKYCTVTSYMSKGPEMISNNHMCAERQLIRRLYRECLKKGYKSHQFTEWLHRKYGHLVITRRNTLGDAIPTAKQKRNLGFGSDDESQR